MAVERGSAVSSFMERNQLWRSKSQHKLETIVVLGDHDGVVGGVRGVGAQAMAKEGGAPRRRSQGGVQRWCGRAAGGSGAGTTVFIVFTPVFFASVAREPYILR